MTYITEIFSSAFDRKVFSCGNEVLDNYLKTQASQDIKKKLAQLFILSDKFKIMGYYTLSATSVSKDYIPENIANKMPGAYNAIPSILLGRLAVDNLYKGKRLGEALLIDALKRSFDLSENSLGAHTVIVDPIDKQAENFYTRYGFILLPGSGKMFIAMKTIKSIFL